MFNCLKFLLSVTLVLFGQAFGEEHSNAFSKADSLASLQVTGDATRDKTAGHAALGCLKVAPGSSAIWKLRDANNSGRIDLWVLDDGKSPKNPKVRRGGPQWGLIQKNGRLLTVGAIYAPYLSGQSTYAAGDYLPPKEMPWFMVRYLAIKREPGKWRQWTFDLDAQKGLRILVDGKDVNSRRKRYDWNQSKVEGFVGVALIGDKKDGEGQTFWVDEIKVTLGGPMQAKPVLPPPPPPPPPVVPEKDPGMKEIPQLVEAVRGKHPRLLFTEDEVARIRALAAGEGKTLMERVAGYLPSCKAPEEPKFLRDATDGQRHGFWRMPTVGLHYVLTGDKQSFEQALGYMKFLLSLENWETGKEADSGMSAANIMVGAALLYDWLYHDLEPEFRSQYRKKLIHHARSMYHGGHLKKRPGTHYWQNDPANNHRWHRNAGLALCALAVYEGEPELAWLITELKKELAYVVRWLPPDGTSHEGPSYFIFGGNHLTVGLHASDICFGTKYLKHPYFKNGPLFRMHTVTPGLKDTFPFGDGGGFGAYNNFLYRAANTHGLKDAQSGLQKLNELHPAAFDFAWFSLIWLDPDLQGGDFKRLAKTAFFPDLGLAFMRDGWNEKNTAAMFKCGPFGGYKLNEFRNTNNFTYINVAHDDPDANSFLLWADGALLAETSRYSKHKKSHNHNTILVNGKGQSSRGRPEGGTWTQPATGKTDMTEMARITTLKEEGDIFVIEGEAAGSYPALRRIRPALSRYRRTFIWVKSRYILVLDDIRAPEEVEFTWLMQSGAITTLDSAKGRYLLKKGAGACEFQVVADRPGAASIGQSPADNRGNPLGWKQLSMRTKSKSWRLASVYDIWKRGALSVSLANANDAIEIQVSGNGIKDMWVWRMAMNQWEPALLNGKVADAEFSITEKDVPPPAE